MNRILHAVLQSFLVTLSEGTGAYNSLVAKLHD